LNGYDCEFIAVRKVDFKHPNLPRAWLSYFNGTYFLVEIILEYWQVKPFGSLSVLDNGEKEIPYEE
jgi:hypothetical protein